MRTPMRHMEYADQYATTYGAMLHCLSIRNTYAHCHWANSKSRRQPGLWYINLLDAVKPHSRIRYNWLHIDAALLTKQEAYVLYTLGMHCVS
jgi:hypothetical protein